MSSHNEPVREGPAPLVSIVVVTYNALSFTRLCLEGIQARTRLPYELIVVDNASDSETREYLQSLSADGSIRLIQNEENRLWTAGNNQGMRASDERSRYLLLLNSDVEVLRDDWLEVLVHLIEVEPRVAIVGPQHNRVSYGPVYGYIDGHCLMFRRELLAEVGYFDEVRWPWFGAPGEMAVAAFSRGWIYKVVHPADRLILHHGGKSQSDAFRKAHDTRPRARRQFREIMARYGLSPQTPFLERKFIPQPLRRLAERRRFYYSPPVGRLDPVASAPAP